MPRVRIKVIDSWNQEPIHPAKVVVKDEVEYELFTDEEGIAETSIPAGKYIIEVSAVDYAPVRHEIEITRDTDITIPLKHLLLS